MRNIKEAWFPRPMRFDPSQRDPNIWCEYHATNGHQTTDCRHLREEVATLLKNRHLSEFLSDRTKNNYGRNQDNTEPQKIGEDPPRLTINIIFGGNEINDVTFSAAKKTKVSVTHSKDSGKLPRTISPSQRRAPIDSYYRTTMPWKFSQYHSIENAGTRQANRKHHFSHNAPRRVQLSKCDNPMGDPAAHKH
nr:uncharacterized protein LOC104108471 [Nicotiana tomentosiformis]